ncbi:hypothetical protein, partial [Mycobacterium tuberculosis]
MSPGVHPSAQRADRTDQAGERMIGFAPVSTPDAA